MKVTIELEYHIDIEPSGERVDDLLIGVIPDIQSAAERKAEGSGFIYTNEGKPVGRWTTREKKS